MSRSALLVSAGRRALLLSNSAGQGFARGSRALSSSQQEKALLLQPLCNFKTVTPQQMADFTKDAISESKKLLSLLKKTVENPSFPKEATTFDHREVLVPFDRISNHICLAADTLQFLQCSHPSPEIRQKAFASFSELVAFMESLNMNDILFKAVSGLCDAPSFSSFDSETQRTAVLFREDFLQRGMSKSNLKPLPQVADLLARINSLMYTFEQLVQESGGNFLTLPADLLAESLVDSRKSLAFRFPKDKANLSYVDYDHLLFLAKYVKHEPLRQKLYETFYDDDGKASNCLLELVQTRQDLAQHTGFASYSDMMLSDSWLGKDGVSEFLSIINDRVRRKVEGELRLFVNEGLLKEKNLHIWDQDYLISESRARLFPELNDLSPFFSLQACVEGLKMIAQDLLGVELRQETRAVEELWHPSVMKFNLFHHTRGHLGIVYFDFMPREGKFDMSCHFAIQNGFARPTSTHEASNSQLPISVLNCSFGGRSFEETLLTFDGFETLLHEFGHVMHNMLSSTQYQHVAGTRCPLDFAELPSSLLEGFASDYRVVSKFAFHVKTKQVLPKELFDTFLASRRLGAGLSTQAGLLQAAVDFHLHSRPANAPKLKSTSEVFKETANQFSVAQYHNICPESRYRHLATYASRYYSYLWCKALASLLWRELFAENPWNRAAGERYVREVLVKGNSVPQKSLIETLLRRSLTIADVANALPLD